VGGAVDQSDQRAGFSLFASLLLLVAGRPLLHADSDCLTAKLGGSACTLNEYEHEYGWKTLESNPNTLRRLANKQRSLSGETW
jgi:hypothetical protein